MRSRRDRRQVWRAVVRVLQGEARFIYCHPLHPRAVIAILGRQQRLELEMPVVPGKNSLQARAGSSREVRSRAAARPYVRFGGEIADGFGRPHLHTDVGKTGSRVVPDLARVQRASVHRHLVDPSLEVAGPPADAASYAGISGGQNRHRCVRDAGAVSVDEDARDGAVVRPGHVVPDIGPETVGGAAIRAADPEDGSAVVVGGERIPVVGIGRQSPLVEYRTVVYAAHVDPRLHGESRGRLQCQIVIYLHVLARRQVETTVEPTVRIYGAARGNSAVVAVVGGVSHRVRRRRVGDPVERPEPADVVLFRERIAVRTLLPPGNPPPLDGTTRVKHLALEDAGIDRVVPHRQDTFDFPLRQCAGIGEDLIDVPIEVGRAKPGDLVSATEFAPGVSCPQVGGPCTVPVDVDVNVAVLLHRYHAMPRPVVQAAHRRHGRHAVHHYRNVARHHACAIAVELDTQSTGSLPQDSRPRRCSRTEPCTNRQTVNHRGKNDGGVLVGRRDELPAAGANFSPPRRLWPI